ncbi:Uma2 family endonuclease [Trichocoleus sp. FACHB-262]|uniref:Uma2 family endonuclease n=1 Tax=Trichocoleus sp. FACHB-262 TaxID=2692869 RepID=UPI0024112B91|nr:Uma2 family endonuclease [Trichocoleus sp. FACHB-262]
MQYQDRGIPEYWIVDPQQQTVLVLELSGDVYTEISTLQGEDPMRSPQFGELNLTVAELFAAGQPIT